MRRALVHLLPVLAYAGLLFYLSSLSTVPSPGLPGFDKVEHLGAYGVLGLLIARALGAYGVRAGRAAVGGLLIGTLYGVSDEYHQRSTPGRSSDVNDVAADGVGAGLGALVWYAARGREPAPGRPRR